MIAYEELERALGRWKARRAGTPAEAAPTEDAGAPTTAPHPTGERTGELDIGDVVETYDEA